MRSSFKGAGTVVLATLAVVSGRAARADSEAFEAIATSPTEIHCYWLAPPTASGYTLLRDGQQIAALPAGATEYVDAAVGPGTTHTYTLRTITTPGSAPLAASGYVERSFDPFPASPGPNRAAAHATFDVVVIQASSGGVAAAIEAGRRGLRVALVESTTRVGGMPVNGLSATDLRRGEHASGLITRFRDRVKALYAADGVKTNGLQYEPRIAHQAMKSLLYEAPNITLYRRARMVGVETGAGAAGRRVQSVVIEELGPNGTPTGRRARLDAKVFVDGTDCGDLAAWAHAPYRIGRESRSVQEPHNGVIYYDRKSDKLLPGSTGKADRRIQSYAYLVTVKDYGPGADKTIPMPAGYHKEDYIHTPAWKESWAVTSGKMPNGKYELNQHPQGGDYQEINYRYPEGNYAERDRVEKMYRDRGLGYLYYIQTEQGQRQIGLPDDEYRDSGGFPPLLYVREGRRIVGEQLPVEADITKSRDRAHPESIGLGDYPMDSHAVRTKTDWTTPDMGEGEWWLYQYTPTHELPIGVIVPKALDNVFVTTAVSSTHVSFGTYRLEPVRMAFGQAAGIAAAYCIRYHLAAREVPARQIQDELLPHIGNPLGDSDVMLTYFSDIGPENPHYRFVQYLAARGFRPTGETFQPAAPTTRVELARWLGQLVERSAREPRVVAHNADGSVDLVRDYSPYMGLPAVRSAAAKLAQAGDPSAVLTRREIAHWLAAALPALPLPAPSAPRRYTDLDADTARDAAVLAAHGIDSILWDNWSAIGPDGGLLFRPDAPLRHDAMFATLDLAQIGFGPAFYDHPMDGGKGRQTAPTPTERLSVPGH